jgi:hypothetical protein
MQCHPCAEGVAEEITRCTANLGPHGLRHQTRCRRQICSHRPRVTVARKIDGDERVRRSQEIAKRAPEPPCLGEAVQENQRWTGPANLNVEWHDG